MSDLKQFKVGLLDDLADYTTNVNRLISEYNALQHPLELGPEYAHLTSYDDAQINLVHHRMKKKWGAPDLKKQRTVREKSVLDVFAYDSGGPSFTKDVYFVDCDPFVRKILYETRNHLSEMLRKYYRFKPSSLRMPSGESDKSARGDVSVLAKLRDKKQWRVTADCVDLFCTVVYNVPALKRSARVHIGRLNKYETKCLYSCYSDSKHVGYDVFRELLISEVLTIVPGSRIETVPKELDKLRVISCEPFGNMIVQSVIEEGIRDVIRKEFGIDLDTSAEIHKELAKCLENATIDLKNASNSNFLCWIRWLYPAYFTRSLEKARSPVAAFRGNTEVIEHHWNMVAPMGNGFTFGLMTLTLLTISRQIDSFAHVFGDDIIVHTDCAATVISVLDFIGFKVNETKTFTEGRFRESCGAFVFDSQPIKSFNFEWAENACEAHTLVNKVQILASSTKCESLRILASSLVSIVPYLCRKASVEVTLESRWVCITSRASIRRKREQQHVRDFFKYVIKRKDVRLFCKKNQIDYHDLDLFMELTLENHTYKCRLPVHNANAHWTSYFLYTGRCVAPVLKASEEHPLILEARLAYNQFVTRSSTHEHNQISCAVHVKPHLFPPSYLFRRALKSPPMKNARN